MKINNKSMQIFAMFASMLILTVVAMPMVAAEDEGRTYLDATEIYDETHAEIKELLTELDIAIINYNQASRDGLPTYEYAEEIDAITEDLAELGVEFELQRIIELEAVIEPICSDEFEDLYEDINELVTELNTLILSHNEAYKAGDMDAVYEYGQEIDEIVKELAELGVHVEIERNSIIAGIIITIIGGWVVSSIIINRLESDGGNVCGWCYWSIKGGGIVISVVAYLYLKYIAPKNLDKIDEIAFKLVDILTVKPSTYMALIVSRYLSCDDPNCVIGRV